MKTRNTLLLSICIGIFFSNHVFPQDNKIKNTVKICGTLENYSGIYNTGKLTFYDALTRDINDKIFPIDGAGNFSVNFYLPHPIFNSISFDLEGKYYSNFLIEPNTNYTAIIKDSKIHFTGKTGKLNQEISKFKDSFNIIFMNRSKKADRLHEQNISFEEYIAYHKKLENDKLSFLTSYFKKRNKAKKIKTILANEIKFKTANVWINYRFAVPNSGLKKSLPDFFYDQLFQDYSILTNDDYHSKECIDYISNVVSALSIETIQASDLVDHFKTLNLFSTKEVEMISKAMNGDRSILQTDEFKQFNKENETKLREINWSYNFLVLLKNSYKLKKGLTKDLVISQGISKYYFRNYLIPSKELWSQLESIIENEWILNYLKEYSKKITPIKLQENKQENVTINLNLEEVTKKYIHKYKGKVVYIDFYATWCGPCRQEIPYAKQLHLEFKNKDVVFLNLCAKSKLEDWNNFIKQYEIEGENFLLTPEEFNLLSNAYNVKGFPTYILIDKDGITIDPKAPRPSSKKIIYDKINTLLLK
jgi:thiol-disulfide isomerase/thioredoxin